VKALWGKSPSPGRSETAYSMEGIAVQDWRYGKQLAEQARLHSEALIN
jgi:hypothetical protein